MNWTRGEGRRHEGSGKEVGKEWGIWEVGHLMKRVFFSQESSCQSDLVAFVVPPFHCDLTLSQGETRDKHGGLTSISPLTQPRSLSFPLCLPLSSRHANPSVHHVYLQRQTASCKLRIHSKI